MRRGNVLFALLLAACGCRARRDEIRPVDERARESPPVRRDIRFVAKGGVGKPLRIEGCRGDAPCVEWVRFPPPRAFVEAAAAPSGGHFYVWTKPDKKPRQLDLYRVPSTEGPALHLAHLEPRFGGTLTWTPGDRLHHRWGCGTGCSCVRVYDASGTTRFEAIGVAVSALSSDTRRVAVAHGDGRFELFDVLRFERWKGKLATAGAAVDIAFEPDGFVVDEGKGEVRCKPTAPARLDCARR